MSTDSAPTSGQSANPGQFTTSGLSFVVSGSDTAPPAMLVHGSLDRSAGLLKLSRRLDTEYRVARYDRRGYGRSRSAPPPFTMSQHVDDLTDTVREALGDGVRLRLLFGHSYGGNVALAYASRFPDAVDAVVTYESPLSWKDWWPGTTAGAASTDWGHDPAGAAEAFMRRLVGDQTWERLPESTRTARRAEGVTMVDELRDLRLHAPWEPERITVPVLALHGENSLGHHRRAMSELSTMLPHATNVEIAGASHFGPNTHPQQTAAAISEFMQAL